MFKYIVVPTFHVCGKGYISTEILCIVSSFFSDASWPWQQISNTADHHIISRLAFPSILYHRDIEEPSDNVDAIATLSPRTREARQLDVVGQQMKFSAILKLLLDELYSIPASCEIAGEDVRPFFLKWLEKEMKVLHKLADYGTVAEESDDEEDVTSDQSAAGGGYFLILSYLGRPKKTCFSSFHSIFSLKITIDPS